MRYEMRRDGIKRTKAGLGSKLSQTNSQKKPGVIFNKLLDALGLVPFVNVKLKSIGMP